ncbi:hypothetical protein KIN20_019428 [Parelaphostrongylus tenuis]|uniref:Uncharacterized protein n=1 Tax=Parelaphostrongylus tenuis TaxID=148309 RepID=A0AAD5N277_PARTN|nr:hypothetical protein KIN20_019428 [Parelaphostrongylus tenuis]
MVYSTAPNIKAQVPGISSSEGAVQAFVHRLVMQTVFDVLEEQARSALLPDAVISDISGQLEVHITYLPLSCEMIAFNPPKDMSSEQEKKISGQHQHISYQKELFPQIILDSIKDECMAYLLELINPESFVPSATNGILVKAKIAANSLIISLLAIISTVLGCGVVPTGQDAKHAVRFFKIEVVVITKTSKRNK